MRGVACGAEMILMNVIEVETLLCDHYCGVVPIFFMIDWISEAASLHVRETSWLLALASFSAQLLITLLSISR